jgi:hypothetical protein
MIEFALRGVFYLGDSGSTEDMVAQADHLMQHLLDVERWNGSVHDAAVSLDAGARTVTVELVVAAERMIYAHNLASVAVNGAFMSMDAPEERSIDMVPA